MTRTSRSTHLQSRTVLAALLLLCGLAASAQPPSPANAGPADAEQRVRDNVRSALSQLAESGALGPHPERISLRLDEPARRVTNIGALIDSTNAQSARDGLHVLGATPGSTADRLGLRPGDRIVAVNGTSLRNLGSDEQGHALAASTMRNIVDGLPDAATVDVDIVRGGQAVTLSAPVQSVYVPAMHVALGDGGASAGGASPGDPPAVGADGCGRISTFDVAPRGERLYGATILLLDGNTPGPQGTPSFRVAAGEHHLVVAENIPTQALGVGEIATLRRKTSKPLTVVVRPGMTALVAAQLHLENAGDLSHGSYWDPVVWRQIAERCP